MQQSVPHNIPTDADLDRDWQRSRRRRDRDIYQAIDWDHINAGDQPPRDHSAEPVLVRRPDIAFTPTPDRSYAGEEGWPAEPTGIQLTGLSPVLRRPVAEAPRPTARGSVSYVKLVLFRKGFNRRGHEVDPLLWVQMRRHLRGWDPSRMPIPEAPNENLRPTYNLIRQYLPRRPGSVNRIHPRDYEVAINLLLALELSTNSNNLIKENREWLGMKRPDSDQVVFR